MGSPSDDAWWGSKAIAWCHYHKEDMYYDEESEAWLCPQCNYEFGA